MEPPIRFRMMPDKHTEKKLINAVTFFWHQKSWCFLQIIDVKHFNAFSKTRFNVLKLVNFLAQQNDSLFED